MVSRSTLIQSDTGTVARNSVMDQPNTKLGLIGSIIGVVGLVTCAVSTLLNYWYYFSISVPAAGVSIKIYFGLWEFCQVENSVKQCNTWSELADAAKAAGIHTDGTWLQVCDAFMLMACLSLTLGVIFGFLFSVRFKSSKQMMIAAGALCLIAGSLTLVAAIVFATKYAKLLGEGQDGGNLHACYGLAIVTVVLAKVAGIVILRTRVVFRSSYP